MRLFFSMPIIPFMCLCLVGFSLACKGGGGSGVVSKAVTNSGPGVLAEPILKRIPSSALAFGVVATGSKSFEEYMKSPWGSTGSSNPFGSWQSILKSQATGLTKEQTAKNDELAKVFEQIATTIQKQTTAIAAYAAPATEQTIYDAGAVIQSKSEAAASELIRLMIKGATEGGLKVEEKDGAYSLKHDDSPMDFHIKQQKEFIIAANNFASLAALQDPAEDQSGVENLVASSNFKKARSKQDHVGSEFLVSYVDLEKLFSELQKYSKKNDVPENFPIKAALLNNAYDQANYSNISLVTAEVDPKKKSILSSLKEVSSTDSLASLPAGSPVSIYFNAGPIVSGIEEYAIQIKKQNSDNAQANAAIDKYLPLIKSLKSIALGIEDVAPGGMFPGLFFSFEVSEPEKFATELQSLAEANIAQHGGMQIPWQKKKVAERDVNYMLSPFGVGLYLTNDKDHVLLASNESSIAKALSDANSGAKSSDNYAQVIPDYNKPGNFASMAISFPGIAQMIQNLSGSMAMFTGGKPLLAEVEIQTIKALGELGTSATYADNTIVLKTATKHLK